MLVVAGCEATWASVFDDGCDECSTSQLGASVCRDGALYTCREGGESCSAGELEWHGVVCGWRSELDHECIETEPGRAYCREADAERCSPPGSLRCDGPWVITCTEQGCTEHESSCGRIHWPAGPGDYTCVAPTSETAICAFPGSTACDPATFGSQCVADAVVMCDPVTRWVAVDHWCPAGCDAAAGECIHGDVDADADSTETLDGLPGD